MDVTKILKIEKEAEEEHERLESGRDIVQERERASS
jgi:hypothetical protein